MQRQDKPNPATTTTTTTIGGEVENGGGCLVWLLERHFGHFLNNFLVWKRRNGGVDRAAR